VQDNPHESKHNRGGRSRGQHQKKRIANIPPKDSLIFDAATGVDLGDGQQIQGWWWWLSSGRWHNKFRGGGGGSVLGAGVYAAGHVASGLFEVNLMGLGN
jgi:hypothetical protein